MRRGCVSHLFPLPFHQFVRIALTIVVPRNDVCTSGSPSIERVHWKRLTDMRCSGHDALSLSLLPLSVCPALARSLRVRPPPLHHNRIEVDATAARRRIACSVPASPSALRVCIASLSALAAEHVMTSFHGDGSCSQTDF